MKQYFPDLARLTAFLTLSLSLWGCGVTRTVPMQVDYPADSVASAVDIDSYGGIVRVIADPLAKGIGVESSVHVPRWVDPHEVKTIIAAADVTAEVVEDDNHHTILRVKGSTAYPDDTASDLYITVRMPSVEGTRVQLVRGDTELVNVAGAIQVSQVQGNITLRTSKPLTDPVLLVTGKGNINAAIDPGSTGVLDLSSHSGRVTCRVREGVTRDVSAGYSFFRGILNQGSNPVKMEAVGNVLLNIRSDAGSLVRPR